MKILILFMLLITNGLSCYVSTACETPITDETEYALRKVDGSFGNVLAKVVEVEVEYIKLNSELSKNIPELVILLNAEKTVNNYLNQILHETKINSTVDFLILEENK